MVYALNNWSRTIDSQKELSQEVDDVMKKLDEWFSESFSEWSIKDNLSSMIANRLWISLEDLKLNNISKDAEDTYTLLSERVWDIFTEYEKIKSWISNRYIVKWMLEMAFKKLQKMKYVLENSKVASSKKDNKDQEANDSEDSEEQSEKIKTDSEKIKELEEKLKATQVLYPDIIRMSLVKNPTKIPQYLWRKIRNSGVNRKSRDPIDFVYALKTWSRKAFIPARRKIKNAYPLCQKLIEKQKKIMADNAGPDGFRPEYLNAENRLAQLNIVLPQLKALSQKNTWKLAVGASDYAYKKVA